MIKIWQAKKTRKWKDKFATLFSIMIAKRNLQLARFMLEKSQRRQRHAVDLQAGLVFVGPDLGDLMRHDRKL